AREIAAIAHRHGFAEIRAESGGDDRAAVAHRPASDGREPGIAVVDDRSSADGGTAVTENAVGAVEVDELRIGRDAFLVEADLVAPVRAGGERAVLPECEPPAAGQPEQVVVAGEADFAVLCDADRIATGAPNRENVVDQRHVVSRPLYNDRITSRLIHGVAED